MDINIVLMYVVLGFILGATGQGARAVVGLKKEFDKYSASGQDWKAWFDAKKLVLSIIIGGTAGVLGSISLLGGEVNKEFLLALLAFGYAGTDFIEGFMQNKLQG